MKLFPMTVSVPFVTSLSTLMLLSACSGAGEEVVYLGGTGGGAVQAGSGSAAGEPNAQSSGGNAQAAAGGSASGAGVGGASASGGSASGGASPDLGAGGTLANEDGTPVERHGHLQVVGAQLVNQLGAPVQLKGVSSQWLNWEDDGYARNLDALIWMRDNWNLSLIRAAMGAESTAGGSYLDERDLAGGKAAMVSQVKEIVDNAIEAGVYVIIDFHSHTAHLHQAESAEFFKEMVELYGSVPNVLFETFNEPKDPSKTEPLDWPEIKVYHEAIVAVIRESDTDDNENIVILGTPRWSQDVDAAAADPLTGNNLMYTIHFYSCTHGDKLLNVAKAALSGGLPLFATEWGATEADGGVDGTPVCEDEANKWHAWMNENSIGWAAWKLDDCDVGGVADTSCLLAKDAPLDGGWTDADLNGHGAYVASKLKD